MKLASNENPLGPSPRAIEAIKAALPELNRYPDGASYELIKKIAAKHKVGPERVFAASGSVEVINLLKAGRRFFVGLGQADPALDAVQAMALGASLGAGALGMGDAAAGGHPVDVAR